MIDREQAIWLLVERMRRRLSAGRGCLRRADVLVFLDSGAFSEVAEHGAWTWPAADFAEFVRRTCDALGTVQHAGIQDWMCETSVLSRTGLTVEEHQRRTVASFCLLRRLQPAVPWVPTLQGYTVADYMRCAQMYRDAGVELDDHALVGLGSVCRRSRTAEIEAVIRDVVAGLPARARLHGYGVKSEGALLACMGLASMDSMAWSRRARGLESNLRAALGLAVDAPSDRVLAATDEELLNVDFDLIDFLEWKRSSCLRTAAASQEFAEVWRGRQMLALAARLVDTVLDARCPVAKQLQADVQLSLGLAPQAAHAPRSAARRRAAAQPMRGRGAAMSGPVQGLLLGGLTHG